MPHRIVRALRLGIVTLIAAAAVTAVPAASAEAAGVTGHCFYRSGDSVKSYSTFRPPWLDNYERRVALYNSSGARIYLSPYYWAGPMGGIYNYGWTWGWYRVPGATRALVVYRSIADPSYTWSRWSQSC